MNPSNQAGKQPSIVRRLLWLFMCAGGGFLVGLAGHYFTADQTWFLAIPLMIAAGWLFVADPSACMQPQTRTREGHEEKEEDSGA